MDRCTKYAVIFWISFAAFITDTTSSDKSRPLNGQLIEPPSSLITYTDQSSEQRYLNDAVEAEETTDIDTAPSETIESQSILQGEEYTADPIVRRPIRRKRRRRRRKRPKATTTIANDEYSDGYHQSDTIEDSSGHHSGPNFYSNSALQDKNGKYETDEQQMSQKRTTKRKRKPQKRPSSQITPLDYEMENINSPSSSTNEKIVSHSATEDPFVLEGENRPADSTEELKRTFGKLPSGIKRRNRFQQPKVNNEQETEISSTESQTTMSTSRQEQNTQSSMNNNEDTDKSKKNQNERRPANRPIISIANVIRNYSFTTEEINPVKIRKLPPTSAILKQQLKIVKVENELREMKSSEDNNKNNSNSNISNSRNDNNSNNNNSNNNNSNNNNNNNNNNNTIKNSDNNKNSNNSSNNNTSSTTENIISTAPNKNYTFTFKNENLKNLSKEPELEFEFPIITYTERKLNQTISSNQLINDNNTNATNPTTSICQYLINLKNGTALESTTSSTTTENPKEHDNNNEQEDIFTILKTKEGSARLAKVLRMNNLTLTDILQRSNKLGTLPTTIDQKQSTVPNLNDILLLDDSHEELTLREDNRLASDTENNGPIAKKLVEKSSAANNILNSHPIGEKNHNDVVLTYTSSENSAQTTTLSDSIDRDILLFVKENDNNALHFKSNIIGRKSTFESGAGRLKENGKDYHLHQQQYDRKRLPVGVKSAIIASGAILALIVFGFFALLLSCKIRQKRSQLQRQQEILCKQYENRDARKMPMINTAASPSAIIKDSKQQAKYNNVHLNNSKNLSPNRNNASNRNYYLWKTLRKTFRYD